MTGADALLELQNVSYTYPKGLLRHSSPALHSISTSIGEGEQIVLTGPSGCGKSTFIRCLNGLIPHARKGKLLGDVFVRGMNSRELSVAEISKTVGTVFQDPDYQMVSDNVDAEIAFGPEQLGLSHEEIERAVSDVCTTLGIEDLRGRQTTELSWGERQKVAIASVLVTSPQVLLLDEPFSGLDTDAAKHLLEALQNIHRSLNVTTLVIEHRLTHLDGIMGRLMVMQEGRLIHDGPPSAFDFSFFGSVQADFGDMNRSANTRRPVSPSLEVRNLSYTYPGASSPACKNISFSLYPGEITVLQGPNGCGKSTLARQMNGLLRPDSGEVLIGSAGSENRSGGYFDQVGLVLQHADYQLFEETLERELSFALKLRQIPKSEILERMKRTLLQLDMDFVDPRTPPLNLSLGEKQRVALAATFMVKTPVLILDEPTLGLDNRKKEKLTELLRNLAAEGKTILVITHDTAFAGFCADRILVMQRGRVQEGTEKREVLGTLP